MPKPIRQAALIEKIRNFAFEGYLSNEEWEWLRNKQGLIKRIDLERGKHILTKAALGRLKTNFRKNKAKSLSQHKEILQLRAELKKLKKESEYKYERDTKKLQRMFATAKSSEKKVRLKYDTVRYNLRTLYKTSETWKIKARFYDSHVHFFKRRFMWNNQVNYSQGKQEVIIRMVSGYELLRYKNITNYRELAVLFTGIQLETFSIADIKFRYGKEMELSTDRVVATLVKAGYIKGITRIKQFFLTQKGRERIEMIMKAIYSHELQTYFNEIHYEAPTRKVPAERSVRPQGEVPTNA